VRVVVNLLILLIATGVAVAAEVRVFAAASLTDVLKEIALGYEKASSDKIVFNFAGSNFLARQIEAGAPADIFFSADEAQMDALEKKGLIVAETRRSRLSNSLVIVASSDSDLQLKSAHDLTWPMVKRIALADQAGVPAGIYAKQYLQNQNLWTALSPKIIPTENVRGALMAVESGNVEAAIVYKTDAAISKKTKIAFEIPVSETPGIRYPVALLKDSKEPAAARKFLAHLFSTNATALFQKHGFIAQ
jgi:molybdate transport system substrate-binding protein